MLATRMDFPKSRAIGNGGEEDVQANFLSASPEVNILTISGTLNVFLVVFARFHFSK